MKKIVLFIVNCLFKMGLLSPITIAKLKYWYKFHQLMDLKTPKNINEKINWLKFYGDTSRWHILADKYKVRDYVKDCGYENSLIPLLGVWKNAHDINWETLPAKFAMKVNNGSGDVLICNDKSLLDVNKVVHYFSNLFKKPYGVTTGEPHYGLIPPCIIAEELLDKSKQNYESTSLIDYKIYCFDGVPLYIWVACNRSKEHVEVALYDKEWNNISEHCIYTSHYKKIEQDMSKPSKLEGMLEMASKLSKDFPFLRVDLYQVDEKVYFGELTLTSLGGYMDYFTEDFLLELGNKVCLSK